MADAPGPVAGSGPSPRLVVLAGPSGVGKGSVVSEIRARRPDVWVSVSWATRTPRPAEMEGVDYHFVDEQTFLAEVGANGFLEYAEYAGHLKGTPRRAVQQHLDAGRPVLLEIDVQGARQVRAAMPSALLVLLVPPSFEELERRLVSRGTEDADGIRRRMEIARSELAAAGEFDELVVNDDVGHATDRLVSLL